MDAMDTSRISDEELAKLWDTLRENAVEAVSPRATYKVLQKLAAAVGGDLEKAIAFMIGFLHSGR